MRMSEIYQAIQEMVDQQVDPGTIVTVISYDFDIGRASAEMFVEEVLAQVYGEE